MAVSDDGRAAFVVRGIKETLKLSTHPKKARLGAGVELVASVIVYESAVRSCSDVFGPDNVLPIEIWQAQDGTATIRISSEVPPGENYLMYLSMYGIVVENINSKESKRLRDITWQGVEVGPSLRDPRRH
jgi:hypothetical protein